MSANTVNARELILDILLSCEKGEYLSLTLNRVLSKYAYLPAKDRAFIKRVCEGSMERRITLDYLIEQCSKVKVNKMKPLIRSLLRMSVYQMKYMDGIPSAAAINEAVILAKKRHFATLKGFVNGVLRAVDRLGEVDEYPSPSVEYSCPEWIVEYLEDNYGHETAIKYLEASLQPSKVVIRANLNCNTPEELRDLLEDENIKSHFHKRLSTAIVLDEYPAIDRIKAFSEGRFSVQDIGSQYVGEYAGVSENMQVLDLCSAPGGKAVHIAELLNGTGHVSARDVSEYKIPLIEDNIERLQLKNIDAEVSDATVFNSDDEEKYDIVIADVPCSGLGVIGRKSDLKYRVSREDIDELVILQRKIIDNAVRYVKKGGKLIYSTCTITAEENVNQVKYITDNYAFKIPEGKENLQLMPGNDDCDGFFISCLEKIK